uniref:Uncharacterized protein n=1 Tax=Panagrolaimus superbus TaxID=310955 RepID=A0A914YA63_9BILA
MDQNFEMKLCEALRAIGINIDQCYTVIVENMADKENISKLIKSYENIKYFLMIADKPHFNAVMKSIKYETNINGNYKDFDKIRNMFDLCLEINRQCRGINYKCPKNFPISTAFCHFIITDKQISCGTNATKVRDPHIFVPWGDRGEIDLIAMLDRLCCKLTHILQNGFLFQDKYFKTLIITFENYLTTTLSDEIAEIIYETVIKWMAFVKIGIAEVTLEAPFQASENRIKSCLALKYEEELDSEQILKLMELCRFCNDLRLKADEITDLPEHIKIAHIHYSNIIRNYNDFKMLIENDNDSLDPDDDDFIVPVFDYPKIMLRNHTFMTDENDISLYSVDWSKKKC